MSSPDVTKDTEDSAATTRTASPVRSARFPRALIALALAALLLAVVGVLALLSNGGTTAPTSVLVGTRFAAFSEPSVVGTSTVTVPWATGHPAVLLFFGYWCGICHEEVRALGPALGRGDLGAVRVIGVDSDASLAVARSFLAANDVSFPVARDYLPVLTAQYVPADPAAIFVSAQGRIVAVHYGAITLTELRKGAAALVSP